MQREYVHGDYALNAKGASSREARQAEGVDAARRRWRQNIWRRRHKMLAPTPAVAMRRARRRSRDAEQRCARGGEQNRAPLLLATARTAIRAAR